MIMFKKMKKMNLKKKRHEKSNGPIINYPFSSYTTSNSNERFKYK